MWLFLSSQQKFALHKINQVTFNNKLYEYPKNDYPNQLLRSVTWEVSILPEKNLCHREWWAYRKHMIYLVQVQKYYQQP